MYPWVQLWITHKMATNIWALRYSHIWEYGHLLFCEIFKYMLLLRFVASQHHYNFRCDKKLVEVLVLGQAQFQIIDLISFILLFHYLFLLGMNLGLGIQVSDLDIHREFRTLVEVSLDEDIHLEAVFWVFLLVRWVTTTLVIVRTFRSLHFHGCSMNRSVVN